MEIFKVNLRIRDCMDKEWMLANGNGAYSMQTVSGTNTRSYHGLLIGSLNNPLNRNLFLSNFNEEVNIGDERFNLSTMMTDNYVSDGYRNLHSFKYKFNPEINFKIVKEYNKKTEEIYISKKIQMEREKNTVVLIYDIKAKSEDVILNLQPLLNYRDFHSVNSKLSLFQKAEQRKGGIRVKYNITNTNPGFNDFNPKNMNLYIFVSDSEYEVLNLKYNNMHYFREKERGFDCFEDVLMPGNFKIKIPKNTKKRIYVYGSLEDEDKDVEKIFLDEEKRKKELIKKAKLKIKENTIYDKKNKKEVEEFLEDLVLASDYFIVNRDKSKAVIAGYPWFADWGRDSLISLEGLFLKTGRFEEAKQVLENLIKDLNWGLIPNSYDEYTKKPLYNSADASLLYFEAIKLYYEYTKDETFVKKNMDNLREIIKLYKIGTDYDGNNIYLDEDYLLNTGTEKIQNTWMDAKIGDKVVTPRNGKAVEINALWYNALKILAEFEGEFGKKTAKKELESLAEKTKKSFIKSFKSERKGLKDLIDKDEVRPNQLFALWTQYNVVDSGSDLAKEIIEICERRLKNRFGLKSLEKGPKYYIDEYSGDSVKRDMSYHQGVSWVWLLELYYKALEKRYKATSKAEDKKKYIEFVEETIKTFMQNLYQKPCVMSINEINDSTFPYDGKGAVSQAWSVSAIIKIVSK